MATHVLRLQPVLSDAEYGEIDRFCAPFQGVDRLPDVAGFLQRRFVTAMVLDPDIIAGFTADSSNLPGQSQGLCRPKTERECAIVFRACFAARVPMTLSGGRSNLTGSATPEGGVVISTAEMAGPDVCVDVESRTAVAPVGMILEPFRERVLADSHGTLHFPVDPTSRADASVGGALACNASGFTPGDAGATRSWVQSLRMLLPSGMLVEAARGEYVSEGGRFLLPSEGGMRPWPVPTYARPSIKNAGGPYSAPDGRMDFVDLAIGSEGIFGLVTGCSLKLAPRPGDYLDLFFSVPGEAQALALMEHVLAEFHGDLSGLSAFEYFGVNSRRHMDHQESLFRGDNQVALYVQQPLHDGGELEAAAEGWLTRIAEARCGVDEEAILLLDDARRRALFMEARHSMPANAVEVVRRRGTCTIMTDTVVPPPRFREFLAFTHQWLAAERLDYLSFGHLGDCHLHFTILPEKEQLAAGLAAYDAIVAKSAELGGVYSGEHGTGKRKRKDFLRCYGPEAVEQVRRCKQAVDPDLLLNRGNVFSVEG